MLTCMIETRGYDRVARIVRAAMGWGGETASSIEKAGGPKRSTLDRVKRAEEVSDMTLRHLGAALNMPRDYLLYVRDADQEKVASSGADPDLVRWTLALIDEFPDVASDS